MARARQTKTFNTFVKGLVTEASPLNFPENFALDLDNVELFRDGSIKRRLGLESSTVALSNSHDSTCAGYLWEYADNDPDETLVVIVADTTIYFFDASADATGDLWDNLVYQTAEASSLNGAPKFATVDGKLFVFPFCEVFSWDGSSVTHENKDSTDILVRDFWGVEDTWTDTGGTPSSTSPVEWDSAGADGRDLTTDANIEYRAAIDTNAPADISDAHIYNLFNQGWYPDVRVVGSFLDNPVDYWTGGSGRAPTTLGTSPSNADIWHTYANNSDSVDRFLEITSNTQGSHIPGNRAPMGHYVIPFTNRGTQRQTLVNTDYVATIGARLNNFTVLKNDRESSSSGITRVNTGAGWAGRMFFAGLNRFDSATPSELETTAPDINKYVLFSQIVNNLDDAFKCYQNNDPTSEDINDVLASDGGYIKINEVDEILDLVPVGNSLVVVGNNGVWAIQGSDAGFSATNFQVVKVSDIGCISSRGIVKTDSQVFYPTPSGMYVMAMSEVGIPQAQNITESTIQTEYLEIPNTVKRSLTGYYEANQRRVRWLYTDLDAYDVDSANAVFNKELIFDLTLGAWYTNTFSTTATKYVMGYVKLPDIFSISSDVTVSYGGTATDVVQYGSGTGDVIIPAIARATTTDEFFYIYHDSGVVGLGCLNDSTFLDFGTESYDSFIETGYINDGDSARTKRATYLITHFNRTETGFEDVGGDLEALNPSGCLVQAKWSYSEALPTDSTDSASGQFGKVWNTTTQQWEPGGFQAYRFRRDYVPADVNDSFEYGESVITTKNKLRGKGKALRMRFSSDGSKDFQLLGWTLELTGNTRV